METLQRFTGPIESALDISLETVPEPCRPIAAHILKAGGKRLRPLLTVLCCRLLGNDTDDVYPLACSLEMLHAATLLHDDVLDNAASRRGTPAAHIIFGPAATILAGDALLASGNALVARFGDPELTLCYSRATSQTAAGEILEMASLRNPNLDYAKYLELAAGKTACLIAQACIMGALAAKASGEQVAGCGTYGENLGLAFQLVDDALDFAPESQTGKPQGGDLREGKMTPPLRLYRESLDHEHRDDFDRKFSAGAFTEAEMAQISRAVDEEGFAEAGRKLADSHLAKAREALELLPAGPEKDILLRMTGYVRDRRK